MEKDIFNYACLSLALASPAAVLAAVVHLINSMVSRTDRETNWLD